MRWIRAVCYKAAKGPMVRVARERASRFQGVLDGSIADFQLARLNGIWADAWRHVPYYTILKEQHQLPERFDSLEQFSDRMPVLLRQDYQNNTHLFERTDKHPDFSIKTGGTTGVPLCLGIWNEEGIEPGANHLIARSWYGVVPGDKLFMIWGHTHLLGTGWHKWVKSVKRRVKDRFVGYYRANAYRFDDRSLVRMADVYARYKPDYVLGYSGALTMLARHVRGRAACSPKVVIGCAESFPNEDSRRAVSEAFHAPVSMEYGSIECGLVAHERPEGGYQVFWDTHIVEVEKRTADVGAIVITKLTPAHTPLIRYKIGDEIILDDKAAGPLTGFRAVAGRTEDVVLGIHRSAIAIAICNLPGVLQFQVVRKDGKAAAIRVRMDHRTTETEIEQIRSTLRNVNAEFADLPIIQVEDMPKTPAGKVRWWVDE